MNDYQHYPDYLSNQRKNNQIVNKILLIGVHLKDLKDEAVYQRTKASIQKHSFIDILVKQIELYGDPREL